MMDARALLVFVLQPAFSSALALILIGPFLWLIPPRRAWLRAIVWLIPIFKVVLDLAILSPAHWIGAHGIAPDGMKPGTRVGTLGVGIAMNIIPLPFADARMGYTRNPDPEPRTAMRVERHTKDGLTTHLVIHPADVAIRALGTTGALALSLGILAVGFGNAIIRTIRLIGYRRWLGAVLDRARAAPGPERTTVLFTPFACVPFATGFLRPRIVVPDGLAARLTPHQLAAIVRHERAHLRARDPLARVLLGYASDVFWYVPWLVASIQKFEALREHACDEAAAATDDAAVTLARALVVSHDWVVDHVVRDALPAPAWAPAAVGARTLADRFDRLTAPVHAISGWTTVLAATAWCYVALVVFRSSIAGLS